MVQHDAYHALMFDHAAGALDPARALLAEAHIALSPEGRRIADCADMVGGCLLEALAPAPMRAAAPIGMRPSPPVNDALAGARRALAAAIADPDAAAWRRRPLGARECGLPLDGALLLSLPAGGGLPQHGHHGAEWTLVLHGAFEDESGRYGPGDLAYADASVRHRPRASRAGRCVCLVVRDGPMRLTGVWGAMAAGAAVLERVQSKGER
jgi:putative transcriptional regulator